jgi:hypothetical protein
LAAEAFTAISLNRATAVACAIEGVDDPETEKGRVTDISSAAMVSRSTDEEFE